VRTWIAIFVASTITGLIPQLWGGDLLSLWGVLFSGLGAFLGLWWAKERSDGMIGGPLQRIPMMMTVLDCNCEIRPGLVKHTRPVCGNDGALASVYSTVQA
jgi:hypothetical protein